MNRTLLWVLVGALVLFLIYRMRRAEPAPPAASEPPEESLIDGVLRRLREATRQIGLDQSDIVYYDAPTPAPGITRRVTRLANKGLIASPEVGKGFDRHACCASCARG